MRGRITIVIAVAGAALSMNVRDAAAQGCTTGSPGTTTTFTTFGESCYVVPAGVRSLRVVATGQTGEARIAPSGAGARATVTIAVTPGETLYANVAVGGGAAGIDAGAGGGASDLRRCSASAACGPVETRLLVAGGGGGAGGAGGGGSGGSALAFIEDRCVVAGSGTNASVGSAGSGGGGATCTSGGAGGASPNGNPGGSGTRGFGGAGGVNFRGGGGGGGYFGGGGGGGGTNNGGGGGGGSSFGPVGTVFEGAGGSGPSVAITPLAGAIAVAPGALAFGTTERVSSPQPVTVTNTGNDNLAVRGVRISGPNAEDFAIHDQTCLAPVAAGATCEVRIVFRPSGPAGDRTATLTVDSDATSGASDVSLTGTVAAPPPAATPTPTPTIAPPPTARVRLVTRRARLDARRRFRLQLTCPAGQQVCNGTVKVRTVPALGGRKRTLGTRPFQAPAGGKRTVVFTLSRKLAELVRARRPLAVDVFVVGRVGTGAASTSRGRVTLL